MWDYLSFRKMLMPFIIQIVYWVLSGLCVAAGIYIIIYRHNTPKGLAIALLSPLIVRLGCELIMVFFRIYQTLLNIEKNLELSYEGESFEVAKQAAVDTPPTKPLFDIITANNKNNEASPPST